jgi:hypothetical protein
MRLYMATWAAALMVGAASGQTSTADEILQSAKSQAAQGQRAILVTFHASW